jgi:hypothetical protein
MYRLHGQLALLHLPEPGYGMGRGNDYGAGRRGGGEPWERIGIC